MANNFSYSISGINIQTAKENPASLVFLRAAQGVKITLDHQLKDDETVESWFNLAMPTFEHAGQTRSRLVRGGFRGEINRSAKIDQVQIRLAGGTNRLAESHDTITATSSSNKKFNTQCQAPPAAELRDAVVLSVHIVFGYLKVGTTIVDPEVMIYDGYIVVDRA